jgi:hypothetical protein
VRIPKTALAAPLAVGLAIPAFAIGQPGDTPVENPPPQPPAKAYGVICQRAPNNHEPGTQAFKTCVAQHRQGVNGQKSARAAALAACRNSFPPAERNSEDFRDCVAETRTLIVGLRGLKAQL